MRVPIRKPGAYTFVKPDPHMTMAKFEELKAKLEAMKRKQPLLAEEVKRLSTTGDYSENAAYQSAKARLRSLNYRLLDLEDHLKRAIIIKPGIKNMVDLGSKVKIILNNQEKNYLILGSAETDPAKNIISHNSPLGSALLGKKAGDFFSVVLGGKEIQGKIISIE